MNRIDAHVWREGSPEAGTCWLHREVRWQWQLLGRSTRLLIPRGECLGVAGVVFFGRSDGDHDAALIVFTVDESPADSGYDAGDIADA